MRMKYLSVIGLAAAALFQSMGFCGANTGAPAQNDHVSPEYAQVNDIIVVCKTHFDIGYTHRIKELMHYYRTTMIDRALDIMDASTSLPPEQQFVWTSPGWVMEKVLEDWPGQTPQRRQRLKRAFKNGKFVSHALPFSIVAELMEPEEFARAYVFADRVSQTYGLPMARGAKTTDVPSQSRALATGLAQGGVRFMHIGCNWPSGYVHDMPPIFWWEGPDGSRVLTMYSSIYGTCTACWPWGGRTDANIGSNLLPPPNWPYKTWIAIIVTGDNSGPPQAKEVKAVFTEAKAKLPNARIRMGTMGEFANALLAENPNLPVIKGEMPDTWVHGCMSDPGGMRSARNIGPLMPVVETLGTQLRNWGIPVTDATAELARAHEQYLLYNEHTWGGAASVRVYGEAFQTFPKEERQSLEGSWEDKTNYMRTASTITTSLLDTRLAALANGVNQAGPRIVVYNALPWKRSGVVEIPEQPGCFLTAQDVPACGYRTFSVPETVNRKTARDDTVENDFFLIKLDAARARIASIVDKRSGREWVDAALAQGLGQYLNERFSYDQTTAYCRDYQQGRWGDTLHPGLHKPGMPKDVPYRKASPNKGTINITRDVHCETAVMTCPGDPARHLPASSLHVTLQRHQPYIDLEIIIKDKALDNWPEADWLCLPFKVKSPKFRVGRTLGAMDPARDILRGANRHMYAAGPGVTVTDADGAGIAVCPLDHPLISLDTPGCWTFSLDFIPKKPIVFLNLYNNQWNTNYRYWYPGTWSSRVRLWTFDADTPIDRKLNVPAIDARMPLLAASASGPAGKLPATQTGLAVSRPGVLVTAFAKKADGPETLLRVWEQAGVSGKLTITVPERFSKATPINLRGELTGTPSAISKGKISVDLHAYAPASFLIQ
jgi:alpha-mannosidase